MIYKAGKIFSLVFVYSLYSLFLISSKKLMANTLGKIQLSEINLTSLVNSFDDIFFWSGNINHQEFTGNVANVTGYTPEEIISLQNIIFHEDKAVYINSFNESVEKGDTFAESEFRILTKNNEIKWVKESIKIFYDKGIPANMIGKVIDISGLKSKEIKLSQQVSQLKKENVAKDHFFNLLSHELRSPFTSILGFSEILLKETLTEVEKTEYLSFIHSSSDNLLKLINNLLDWSRLKSGKIILGRQKINLRSLLYNCSAALTGTAARKGIEIKIDADKNLKIAGDERLLNIAVTNIISNAVKFSYKDSVVRVKALKFNDEFAEIIIIDKGIGIPEENKINLFRIDKMFSTKGTSGEKGNGFGLTLSKEIIEKHNGELWFYSEANSGSEFHIKIPSIPESILLVGENISLYDTIKKYFSNYNVIKAENPFDAINFSNHFFSAIVTPHKLPLMNGLQLLENMPGKKDNPELKIIITDLPDETITDGYRKFGEAIVLEKNSAEEKIINILAGLLK